jgi:micrococcal nuclease
LYEYQAHVISVYDGDTFRADVDLGFSIWVKAQDFRMLGINAPEMNSKDPAVVAAATKARDALRGMILGKDITIRTQKDKLEKYGRMLATVLVTKADGTQLNVNDWMVQQGLAVVYLL